MMRSLWTAASGMKAQQTYIDNISHNLANVNSIGYKKNDIEFKSLFYDQLKGAKVDENGFGQPTNLEVGHGVRAVATKRDFRTGSVERTDNPLDFAIQGEGFFELVDEKGEKIYTKAGAFRVSLTEDEKIRLATADGKQLLSTDGEPIEFDSEVIVDKLSLDNEGNFKYTNADAETVDLGVQVALVQFNNPSGLNAIGGTYYAKSSVSGEPQYESEAAVGDLEKSTLMQGALEASNVQVVEEMVKMIVAQRAYELNTKAIQTSDSMLEMANSLKR